MKKMVGKDSRSSKNFFTNILLQKILVGVVIVIALVLVALGIRKVFLFETSITRIGFEDIGELATQAAYCTEVSSLEASRDIFGLEIPFTQSKYIFSYDVVIKAGLDFAAITWKTQGNQINVTLPEVKVLSAEVDEESFRVYHEAESVFRQISLEENNQAVVDLKQNAINNAIANGLLDNARSNAEMILRGFLPINMT